jgi:hypothetical protein
MPTAYFTGLKIANTELESRTALDPVVAFK